MMHNNLSGEPDLEDLIWGDVPSATLKASRRNIEVQERWELPADDIQELEAKRQRRFAWRMLGLDHAFIVTAAKYVIKSAKNRPAPYAFIKISGSCLNDAIARDIALLSYLVPLAVVIGGGEEITAECQRRGIPVMKYGPWRETPKKVLDVVVDVMSDLARSFADMINDNGGNAVNLVGTPESPVIFADKVEYFEIDGGKRKAGHFGRIPEEKIDSYITEQLLYVIRNQGRGVVPIWAALGHRWQRAMPRNGYESLNIDGDEALRFFGRRAQAREFVFVTKGVIKDSSDNLVVDYITRRQFMNHRPSMDDALELKLEQGFGILQDHQGEDVRVALVQPDSLVAHIFTPNTYNIGCIGLRLEPEGNPYLGYVRKKFISLSTPAPSQ